MENSTFTGCALMDQAARVVYGAQTEIMIFLFAFGIHALFFGKLRIRSKPTTRKKDIGPPPAQAQSQAPKPRSHHAKELSRLADRYCELKDEAEVLAELSTKMHTIPKVDTADAMCGLLEGAGKAATPQLMSAIRFVLDKRSTSISVELGELLLRNYFGLRLWEEFEELHRELTSTYGTVPSLAMLALKASIRGGDMAAILARMECLPAFWNKDSPGTPSAGPAALISQLARFASQTNDLSRLLTRLLELQVIDRTIDTVLVECVQNGQPSDVTAVLQFAKTHHVHFGEGAYGALMKNTNDPKQAMSLFLETLSAVKSPPKEIFAIAAEWARSNNDKALADRVLAKLPSKPPGEAVGKLLRFYSSQDRSVALNMYREKFKGIDLSDDIQAMHLVAYQCFSEGKRGRSVLESLLAEAPETGRVSLLKSFAREKELQAALLVLWASNAKSTCLYNAAIDACIECRSIEDAQEVMDAAMKAGAADQITYNTIIKAYSHPQVRRGRDARKAMEDMKSAGFYPNCVTYNEILDSIVKFGIEDAWGVLNEMRASGIKPNRITCAIILKAVQPKTKPADAERAIALLDESEEDIDDVLLCSVVDACIRVGRPELLIPQLNKHRNSGKLPIKNAHTYGSIIRAYGFVHDINGVWETWRELRTRHMAPNAVALGCMTEALVNNGEPEAAYELINEMIKDEQWTPLVNAVIYCSVLKGFSHQKRFDRMWTVYNEMVALKLQFSIVTFNTLLDACSRSGDIERMKALLKDMDAQAIKSNVITYSIIVKGYCQENRIDEAFAVVEDMTRTTTFKPDEIMFNTLLDGCARQGMYERGMRVLEEMQKANVNPTNFTLSVLVKLASRSRKLDRCFELCQELSTKFKFRLNVHVYANLINACITNKDMECALDTLEKMVAERVRPDTRSYSLLLRALISSGQAEDAAGLLRAGLSLRNVHPRLEKYEARQLQAQGGLPNALITEVLEGIAGQCHDERLAMALLKELRETPGIKLDPKLQLRLATSAFKR